MYQSTGTETCETTARSSRLTSSGCGGRYFNATFLLFGFIGKVVSFVGNGGEFLRVPKLRVSCWDTNAVRLYGRIKGGLAVVVDDVSTCLVDVRGPGRSNVRGELFYVVEYQGGFLVIFWKLQSW